MSTKPSTIYTFQNYDYDLKITYGFALKELQTRFKIDLMNVLEASALDNLIQSFYLGDDIPIQLWKYYVEKHLGEDGVDKALDELQPAELMKFKDTWWVAVKLFIGPLRGEILNQVLTEVPNLLKKQLTVNLQEST